MKNPLQLVLIEQKQDEETGKSYANRILVDEQNYLETEENVILLYSFKNILEDSLEKLIVGDVFYNQKTNYYYIVSGLLTNKTYGNSIASIGFFMVSESSFLERKQESLEGNLMRYVSMDNLAKINFSMKDFISIGNIFVDEMLDEMIVDHLNTLHDTVELDIVSEFASNIKDVLEEHNNIQMSVMPESEKNIDEEYEDYYYLLEVEPAYDKKFIAQMVYHCEWSFRVTTTLFNMEEQVGQALFGLTESVWKNLSNKDKSIYKKFMLFFDEKRLAANLLFMDGSTLLDNQDNIAYSFKDSILNYDVIIKEMDKHSEEVLIFI